jgi:hypothetical protein
MKLSYEDASVILTGDSNLACWQRVYDYYDGEADPDTGLDVLEADVLHASHHGSRTFFKPGDEDSEAWLEGLEAIAPDAVIVSVGEDNQHDHPHQDMIDAYGDEAGEDNVFETYETGTVVMEVDSGPPYRLVLDTGSYAEDYGWDDDDDGESKSAKGAGLAIAGGAALATAAVIAKRRRQKPSPTRLDNQPAA